MKVGDIVTQSDEFYEHWNCDLFYARITCIDYFDVVYLNKNVTITKINNNKYPVKCSDFHMKFLKVDIARTRKEKLKKINNEII